MNDDFLYQTGIMDYDEAFATLSPHFSTIVDCMSYGWETYKEMQYLRGEDYLSPLSSSTIASIIFDYTIHRASYLFSSLEPDIGAYYDRGFFNIDFHGKILLRFKKFSKTFETSNVLTSRQKRLNQQIIITEDIPWASDGSIIVSAGYRLNETETQIRDMSIICRDQNHLLWRMPLPYEEQGTNVIPAVPIVSGPSEEVSYTYKKLKPASKVDNL